MGRSIWLGLIAAVVVMVLLQLRIKQLFLFFVVVVIGIGTFTLTDSTIKDELFYNSAIGKRISTYTVKANMDRIMMWTAAVDIIKDYPLLGLGSNSGEKMQQYYLKLVKTKGHRFQHHSSVGVHNIYLQNWVDFGLLGLLGYLIWWLALLWKSVSSIYKVSMADTALNSLLIGISAGLVGVMVSGFFENNFRDGEVQTTILTLMGVSLAVIYKKKEGKFDNQPS